MFTSNITPNIVDLQKLIPSTSSDAIREELHYIIQCVVNAGEKQRCTINISKFCLNSVQYSEFLLNLYQAGYYIYASVNSGLLEINWNKFPQLIRYVTIKPIIEQPSFFKKINLFVYDKVGLLLLGIALGSLVIMFQN
jgi:hypothetical protein